MFALAVFFDGAKEIPFFEKMVFLMALKKYSLLKK